MAESFTEKLNLTKRDTGDLNWGGGNNANLDLLDAHAQQSTLRPPRTLLATLGSGAVGSELLGNTVYFYKVTAINAAGETTENKIPSTIEAQISQPSTPLPVILQWDVVKAATGYRIYKSTVSGQGKFLAEVSGESTLIYTDTGNIATNNLISVPTQNNARTSVKKIIAATGINTTPADGTGEVTISNTGVLALRKLGSGTALAGDVKLEGTGLVTLTQDDANNKIQIGVTGGGAAGYASAVVAAPTGIAATDTNNIQTALTAVGTLGGGIVLLREGTYNLNATLSIPAKVTLAGQGRHATVLLGDPTFGASNMINAGGANIGIRDLTVDENFPNRTGNNGYALLLNFSKPLVENIQITRNRAVNGMIFLNDGQMRNCSIINNGNALGTAIVQGGQLIDNCDVTQSQAGNVNDFFQSPGQIMNCRLVRSSGTLSGAGIRLQSSQQSAIGNLISVGSGNNAILFSSGTTGSVALGNLSNGAKITLEINVNSAIVVGNALVVVTNNSGTGTNQIANNS